MGVEPLNKLYAMMLMIYSFTKQAEARTHNQRILSFVSPLTSNILLLAAACSFIFGPCIGYWDCYYDGDTHVKVTACFTIGEVVYLFILVPILASNR